MIDQLFTGFIIGLATWRLAYALTQESVFGWLRDLFGVEMKAHDVLEYGVKRTEQYNTSSNLIGKLLSCLYCTSFWVAIGMWELWHYTNEYGQAIVWVFAVAAVAVLIDVWRTR